MLYYMEKGGEDKADLSVSIEQQAGHNVGRHDGWWFISRCEREAYKEYNERDIKSLHVYQTRNEQKFVDINSCSKLCKIYFCLADLVLFIQIKGEHLKTHLKVLFYRTAWKQCSFTKTTPLLIISYTQQIIFLSSRERVSGRTRFMAGGWFTQLPGLKGSKKHNNQDSNASF